MPRIVCSAATKLDRSRAGSWQISPSSTAKIIERSLTTSACRKRTRFTCTARKHFRRSWFAHQVARPYRRCSMKVEVEQQPQSVATLRIELPPDEVRKEWDAIANNYARYARIPGYRTGKVPKPVIEKKFRKEIQDEVTKKLVSKSYHEAIAQQQLRVVSLTNLEDVEFGEDHSMRFRATVVTAPEFELPDYKSIPIEVPSAEVKEEDVNAALERLREQSADFVDAPDRELAMEDFAVLDFEGAVDGIAITEIAPQASKNLQGGKKFWLR